MIYPNEADIEKDRESDGDRITEDEAKNEAIDALKAVESRVLGDSNKNEIEETR